MTDVLGRPDGTCASGACKHPAEHVVTFIDGRKLAYCGRCTKRIKPKDGAA